MDEGESKSNDGALKTVVKLLAQQNEILDQAQSGSKSKSELVGNGIVYHSTLENFSALSIARAEKFYQGLTDKTLIEECNRRFSNMERAYLINDVDEFSRECYCQLEAVVNYAFSIIVSSKKIDLNSAKVKWLPYGGVESNVSALHAITKGFSKDKRTRFRDERIEYYNNKEGEWKEVDIDANQKIIAVWTYPWIPTEYSSNPVKFQYKGMFEPKIYQTMKACRNFRSHGWARLKSSQKTLYEATREPDFSTASFAIECQKLLSDMVKHVRESIQP